ncbi:hypothetical protein [Segetibacter koreensis]|uniref:hypothetical protein n=1 Tax=Segetibacter koreensis TaxID=398037 RepID=UPI000379CD7F|nr:hypothetical protein [Segetibacter koreensis]
MENLEQETDITLEHSTEAEKEIQEKLNRYYHDQEDITARLVALDDEWDIERVLQLESTAINIAGVILGLTVNKKWFALSLAASIVALNTIAKNGTTALPILRKLGFRTRVEIEKEKYALKAIRGDFKYLLDVPNSVWNAVNR